MWTDFKNWFWSISVFEKFRAEVKTQNMHNSVKVMQIQLSHEILGGTSLKVKLLAKNSHIDIRHIAN